jgi:transposase InsO family protein
MPWQEVSTVELRQKFVDLSKLINANISDLCRRFGISRKTGYKWLNRYQNQGKSGLTNDSKRPKLSPLQTTKVVEEQVINIRKTHAWGGRKIHAYLKNQGLEDVPAASTISDILRRHGLLEKTKSIDTNAYQRFEHEAPNDLWQMDYKGHFALASGRCHPLTVLDDHSRYAVGLKACSNEQSLTVKAQLIDIFTFYGLPNRINVDNGSPWGTQGADDMTQLEVWLIKQGIRLSHSRIYHPQTNGKIERFHRSLKQELLARHTIAELSKAQELFDEWRHIYNQERPHEALNNQTPADRYAVSPRAYTGQPIAFEYAPEEAKRKVDAKGRISFKNQSFCIGKGLFDEYVAIRETEKSHIFSVYFLHHRIKEITLEDSQR